jgi:hypothetical protein
MSNASRFRRASKERSGGWRERVRLLGAALVVALVGGLFMGTSPAGANASISGAIEASDPQQYSRVKLDTVVSTCNVAKTNPGIAPGSPGTFYEYDAYALKATPGSCVTVTLSSGTNVVATAYAPTYAAGIPGFNYLADPGESTGPNGGSVAFSFVSPPSGTSVLVVTSPTDSTGAYNLQVTGGSVLDVSIDEALAATDPLQGGRIRRNSVQSTCAGPKPNPGLDPTANGTEHHYDIYAYRAIPGACVSVALEAPTANFEVVAHSPAFAKSNPSGHYLGDAGLSTGLDGGVVTFSFLAPPSGTFLLKVSDVLIPGPGTGPYSLHVSGASPLEVTVDGDISDADPSQMGRLHRNVVQSTCASPKPNPGVDPNFKNVAHNYDVHAFTAIPGTCVRVALEADDGNFLVAAHSPSFSPSDVAANYLGDPGFSTSFGGGAVSFAFTAPPSGKFVLVVNDVDVPTGAVGPYKLHVSGATQQVTPPADTTAPTCFMSAVRRPGPSGRDEMDVTVQDTGSGLAAITNVKITNGTVATKPSPIPAGTTAPVVVTATKAVQGQPTSWSFDAVDVAGNVKHCA